VSKDFIIQLIQPGTVYALYRMGYHGRATTHGFRAVASTILNESFSSTATGLNVSLRTWRETKCDAPITLGSGCLIIEE